MLGNKSVCIQLRLKKENKMGKFLFILSLSFLIVDLSVAESYSEETYRLPNKTKPENYNVYLHFGNFANDDLTFEGQLWIEINITENTNSIILHSGKLDITIIELFRNNAKIPVRFEFDTDREFLKITLPNDVFLLENSIVNLKIEYKGVIATTVKGVYRGSYLNSNNETK